MTASAAQLQRRRAKNAAATKARKTKIRVIVLVCIFAIVLVIQGPRTLKLISGSDTSASVAAPAMDSAPPVKRSPDEVSSKLKALRENPGRDPFVSHALVDRDARVGAGPAGLRDPFSPGGTAAAPPVLPEVSEKLVVGTPTRGGVAKRSFIVVLASIPTSRGRSTATRFARAARASGVASGVGSIGLVESSTRSALRPGYYVVYLGSFKTLTGVTAAVAHARRYGFRGPYLRQLVRY